MNKPPDDFLPYEMTNIEDPALLPNLKEINESAEIKAKALDTLRRELSALQDIEPCLEENFLLRFLRVSKFDESKALQRLMTGFKQIDKTLEAVKKTSMSLSKAYSINHLWFSPYRLKNNSCLIILIAGKIDYGEYSFADLISLDMMVVNKFLENPVNQIAGATVMIDFEGFVLRSYLAYTPRWMLMFIETFLNAFPERIKAVHFVNIPSLFLNLYKMIHIFLPKKMKDRMLLHSNDGWKSLHEAVAPQILPEQYGGCLKFDSFINAMENVEELEKKLRETVIYGYIKTRTMRESFRPICR